jgi:hypothetical protein
LDKKEINEAEERFVATAEGITVVFPKENKGEEKK